MIKEDAIILYGDAVAYIDPETGEGYYAGTAKGFVFGGSSRERGMGIILDSGTDEGLVEWKDARNLHVIRRVKGLKILLAKEVTD